MCFYLMITDCNLYSQTYVLEKKEHIYKWLPTETCSACQSFVFTLFLFEYYIQMTFSHFDDSGRQNDVQHQCVDRLVNFCTIMQSNNSKEYCLYRYYGVALDFNIWSLQVMHKDIHLLTWRSLVGCRELKCQTEKREPIHEVL